ncbi:unnamed protein product [Colias eurytheme]|nr:unnamed protein product [Colias eurytheme]
MDFTSIRFKAYPTLKVLQEKKDLPSQMNEDCLFINIYVPANTTNKLMPTLVNIHGGAYSILSGNIDYMYGPQFLLQKDIIYVSMNFRDLVRKLKETDAFDIVDAYSRMKYGDHNILRTYSTLAPCVEMNSTEAIINVDPMKVLNEGLPQNVRVITGFNTNEGLYMLPHIKNNYKELFKLIQNPESLIPSDIEYPRGSPKAKKLADSILEFYFEKTKRTGNDSSLSQLQCLIEYITDIQYIYSIDYWVKKHKARNDSKELFLYEFAFDGQLNWAKCNYGIHASGVAHADELGYIYLTECTKRYFDDGIMDKRTKRMWRVMQDLFSNFIKFGNPTPPDYGMIWPEYGKNRNYVRLNDVIEVLQCHTAKRAKGMKFWDDVYSEYKDYVKNGGVLEINMMP